MDRTGLETLKDAISALTAAGALANNAGKGHTFLYGCQNCEGVMSLFGEEEGQIIPPYKGPLSSYAEWHATVTGFQDGASEFRGRNKNDGTELPTKDARKEPHMYDFGYSLGTLARWIFILTLASYL